MSQSLSNLIISLASFASVLMVLYILYRYLIPYVKGYLHRRNEDVDLFYIELYKMPLLMTIYWVLLKFFTHLFLFELPFFDYLVHFETILLIVFISWLSIQSSKAGAHYLGGKLVLDVSDNLKARKSLTQINVFQAIANSIIGIVGFSVALLTFDGAKTVGLSLLTSAGVIGVIVGFAAQKSIAMILAGIQLAITQPIRLDDVVVVEGEWGRVEEISLTYVIVKIWDERRLVLPVSWFLEKPFENWTHESSEIVGTIFLYVDYSFPVSFLRTTIPELLKDHPDWDGRLWNVQVTESTDKHLEIRILLSSSDASKNWNLKCEMRERIIEAINKNYPQAFSRIRLQGEGGSLMGSNPNGVERAG